jgi:hypothetical protein
MSAWEVILLARFIPLFKIGKHRSAAARGAPSQLAINFDKLSSAR